jgi:hypothetical protein
MPELLAMKRKPVAYLRSGQIYVTCVGEGEDPGEEPPPLLPPVARKSGQRR